MLKVLQDYYLSKVELVEYEGRKYILKSVPLGYEIQEKRQDCLVKKCKRTLIPKIHWVEIEGGRVHFLMDYVESDKKYIPQLVYIKTLSIFHEETIGFRSKLFPVYDFSTLKKEFLEIGKLLHKNLRTALESELPNFEEIFHRQNSIVHGDWVPAQLIGKKNKYAIMDFEMSFYGPSILDHAHFFIERKVIRSKVLNLLNVDKKTFLKARIVETLRKLGWFLWFMDRKFTTYRFEKEIKEYVATLERLMKEYSRKSL